jgi:SNF2-related domain/SNF2 Helicase protein/Helicase conserved C-terminal domain
MSVGLYLYVTSDRRFGVETLEAIDTSPLAPAAAARTERAFLEGQGAGLLHLATVEVKTSLPPGLAYARGFAQRYVTQLCHLSEGGVPPGDELIEPPGDALLDALTLEAPPMRGLEYLDADALRGAWKDMDTRVRSEVSRSGKSVRAWLHGSNPLWRLVGRVTFHLAENSGDEDLPFAFLATYARRVSERGEPRHVPLAHALREFAGAAHRKRLAGLLTPIRDASDRLSWVREITESGDIYHPLAWTPAEAHQFLRDVPQLETCGLVVRIPDWWKPDRRARAQVSVRIGSAPAASLGAQALLDFSVAVTLDREPLTDAEREALLACAGGLVRLRGRWVEADGEKLAAALAHWRRVERDARAAGLSFYEGMRLLAGAGGHGRTVEELPEPLREWSGIDAGEGLHELLARIRHPEGERELSAVGLKATLRPYQMTGAKWLALLTSLGLGACLADDMGLGKTLQVIALLVHLRAQPNGSVCDLATTRRGSRKDFLPSAASLVIAPASLLANWKSEMERFAPQLKVFVAHPSESKVDLNAANDLDAALAAVDVVLTTYGMVARSAALRERAWRVAVLDEAQAIKNPEAQQTRAVKQLAACCRIALTGTPIENRLADLWSLFDYLNPGLLADARTFAAAAKRLTKATETSYAPLRRLVQPYILRRLKSDKRVITDLPEKIEVRAFCGLTPEQAALYERCVEDLARALGHTEGIQRRGTVLAHLMQLKQICNHPAQWSSDGGYCADRSGKFERLAMLCEELSERQDRVLVFTQFREITGPLAEHLERVFGRPGLVLHGGTAVSMRKGLVERFQRDDGPPFFVLSLKAGGTGLNLTAASHVIHFDRWWNPAVENQATDRAFRIGQRRSVLVHKFVCRGTVEEKIDGLIEAKTRLARELLDEGGERLLTEMGDEELLGTVALDIHKACDA